MSLFNENPADQQNNPTEFKFEDLVGEGKKYKTQDDLAKTVGHQHNHIARIEKENAELRKLREQNDRTARLEEMLAQLLQSNKPSNEEQPNREENKTQTPALTENEIEAKIESLLGKKTQEQVRTQNLRSVRDELVKVFGNSYTTVVAEKAEELGLSKEDVDDLASRNPKLFFKTFDVTSQNKVQPEPKINGTVRPPEGSVFSDSDAKPRSYYVNLKRTDPEAYKRSMMQMDRDALKLGDAFFDTND